MQRSIKRISLVVACILIVVSAGAFLALHLMPSAEAEAPEAEESVQLEEEPAEPEVLRYEDVIPPRSNLQEVLSRHDFTREEIHRLLQDTRPVYNLNRVMAGNTFVIERFIDGRFKSLRYGINDEEYLQVEYEGDRYNAFRGVFEFEVLQDEIFGRIEDSLWNSLISSGESDRLVVELASILRWDVDFTALQRGDSFKLIVEKKYLDDQFVKYGDIQAVQFNSGSRTFYGFLFSDPESGERVHYNEKGEEVKKAFLRVPFNFNPRISSGFSHSRLHPILRTRRPHLGVDYAAPARTPVLASANGTVIFAGRRGGYGNMVQIRHPGGYVTSYSHLSSFNVRAGQRVSQGDRIGRVGATGLATGPHLDYRVQDRRGRYIDPRQLVSLPSEKTLDSRYMEDFKTSRDELMRRLESIPETGPDLKGVFVAG